MSKLYVALTHYPVVNKSGAVIASAVTNLDLHDIARVAKTYGVPTFYVVTPLADQQELARKIICHWTSGVGARYNPARRRALELVRIEASIKAVVADIADREKGSPHIVVTCAKRIKGSIGYATLRAMLRNGRPHLLVFGTAWGLASDFIAEADCVLEPVAGNSDYNHLSVRSAAAIILDRLLGTADETD
ncbi:MAG: RNA methyltransferase [Desulfobacterales bacterium]|nr:MAG: RNA methyltransferase [Desulfobacterales bacterium]